MSRKGRGSLRVTGGIYRGRRVACPPGVIRPAMDRMRESLFAILGDIADCAFLDLFSGSGVVGIEAASRGAAPVVLVESDRIKRRTILSNIAFVESPIDLRLVPAEKFLKNPGACFDLVYADPPFRFPRKRGLLEAVDRSGALAAGGRLIIHVPREEAYDEAVGSLSLEDLRDYGGSRLLFYRSPRSRRPPSVREDDF